MNIVCIAADLIPGKLGGAEVHCVEVIKRLSQKHQIILFVGHDPAIQQSFQKNVTVIPINYPRLPNFMGLMYILFGYHQIHSQLSTLNLHPDIIWAKQSFPQAPLAALLARKFHSPLYITAQNPRLLFEELVVSSWLKPFHFTLAKLLDSLIRWSYRQAQIVAAVSTYSAKLAAQYEAKKVVTIGNGINPLGFKVKHGGVGKKVILVTNSSLIPRNGLDTLLEAVALLPAELKWHLYIAGDGPESTNLKLQIKNLKLSSHISMLGRVANVNIPKLLNRSDIFIRPSNHEGFGVAFIEAMASGIPVIGTPVGGIPDFVFDRQTGLLVPPRNPQAIAQAIMTLVTDPKLYRHLQTHALNLVRKTFNWDVISRQVEKVMLSL